VFSTVEDSVRATPGDKDKGVSPSEARSPPLQLETGARVRRTTTVRTTEPPNLHDNRERWATASKPLSWRPLRARFATKQDVSGFHRRNQRE